jgi:hypothetical protein
MAANESSVVVALKEVRRLELDRQRREEENRRAKEDERRRADSSNPASVQYGPGYTGWGMEPVQPGQGRATRTTSEVMALGPGSGGPGQDFAHPQSYVGPAGPMGMGQGPMMGNGPMAQMGAMGWDVPTLAPPMRSRSVAGPVLLTLLLCGGLGAAAYWKLSHDQAAQLTQMQVRIQKTEDMRNEAVAGRSKAEQELKLRMSELEGKLSAASAKASAASAALASAAKNAAATAPAGPTALPTVPVTPGLRKGRAARAEKADKSALLAAKAAPLAAKPAALPPAQAPGTPKLAKKKVLTDDPLGGLKL